uniref:Uncharacterized protein n=1 Tax=Solanum lycopersicum TaxID=4081 RepID=A0A3Q7IJF7_SOLLC
MDTKSSTYTDTRGTEYNLRIGAQPRYILTTAKVTTIRPPETAPKNGLRGSGMGPADPNKLTGRPTKRAKASPVANKREQYSTKSPEAHEKGKESERALNSLTGCWSSGTGHSVSGKGLLFLKDEKGITIHKTVFTMYISTTKGMEMPLTWRYLLVSELVALSPHFEWTNCFQSRVVLSAPLHLQDFCNQFSVALAL